MEKDKATYIPLYQTKEMNEPENLPDGFIT